MVSDKQKKKLKQGKKREWFNKLDLAFTLFLMVFILLIFDIVFSYVIVNLLTDGSNRQVIKGLIYFTIIYLIIVYVVISKRLPILISFIESPNKYKVISYSYNVINFTTTILFVFLFGIKNNIYTILEMTGTDAFVWDFFLLTFIAIINIVKFVFETHYKHYVK